MCGGMHCGEVEGLVSCHHSWLVSLCVERLNVGVPSLTECWCAPTD